MNNSKTITIVMILLFGAASAQEIVIDSTSIIQDPVALNTLGKDSVKRSFKRFKAEGVSAVVGEYVVLDSDIDKSYLELEQQLLMNIENILKEMLL